MVLLVDVNAVQAEKMEVDVHVEARTRAMDARGGPGLDALERRKARGLRPHPW